MAATDSADTTTRLASASAATCRRGRAGLTAEAANSSRASHRPGQAAGTGTAVAAARAGGRRWAAAAAAAAAAGLAAGGSMTAAAAAAAPASSGRRRSRPFHGLPSIVRACLRVVGTSTRPAAMMMSSESPIPSHTRIESSISRFRRCTPSFSRCSRQGLRPSRRPSFRWSATSSRPARSPPHSPKPIFLTPRERAASLRFVNTSR